MLIPVVIDLVDNNPDWQVFLQSAVVTMLIGGSMALSTANGVGKGLTIQQTFLLTTGVWVALPIFGALPFALGELDARPVDAFSKRCPV